MAANCKGRSLPDDAWRRGADGDAEFTGDIGGTGESWDVGDECMTLKIRRKSENQGQE
jgi:hypothetical protein